MAGTGLAAVAVVGGDRPGIVAGVTKGLFELGCNLKDATSTILTGHFAMMLVVDLPPGVDCDAVERALAPIAEEMDLVVAARPVHEAHLEVAEATHMVSVYGADRPGIVYRVADHLFEAGVNITDLSSRVIGAGDRPVYALMLEVVAPPHLDLESGLADLRGELGVEVSVHPLEADIL
jgi:glycine cleavage system transcriptional repressor